MGGKRQLSVQAIPLCHIKNLQSILVIHVLKPSNYAYRSLEGRHISESDTTEKLRAKASVTVPGSRAYPLENGDLALILTHFHYKGIASMPVPEIFTGWFDRMTPRSSQRTETTISPDSRVLDCVNSGLKRFGESFFAVVCYNVEHLNSLKLSEIPRRPDEFEKCLDKMFRNGSTIVKKSIMDQIKMEFDLRGDYSTLRESFEAAVS